MREPLDGAQIGPIIGSMQNDVFDTPRSLFSHRLGHLTAKQLQAALDRFGLGTLIGVEPIPFGLFGQNVLLRSSTGRYVLRGCSHYPWQFPKEQYFAGLLHERTSAPVPWPYLVETSPRIFGWDFALMPCLPGISLADAAMREALSGNEQREVARSLGGTLAELHTVRWPFPGQYDLAAGGVVPLAIPYPSWLIEETRSWVSRARAHSLATTDADVAWVESIIAAAGEALEVPFAAVTVHGDYAYNNALAERREGGWQCSGVIDLMNMSMGGR